MSSSDSNKPINSDVFIEKFAKLKKVREMPRIGQPEGRLLSSRPHSSLNTREKLRELDWEILIRSAIFPRSYSFR